MDLVEELRKVDHSHVVGTHAIADFIEEYYFQKPLFENGDPVDIGSEILWESPNGAIAPAVTKVSEIRYNRKGCKVETEDGYLVTVKDNKRIKKPVELKE